MRQSQRLLIWLCTIALISLIFYLLTLRRAEDEASELDDNNKQPRSDTGKKASGGSSYTFPWNKKPSSTRKKPNLPVGTKPPNILLILADDLGYSDVSCFGSKHIHTPYLDQLAQMGKKFERFYAAAPVCSPTRASILTGRFPLRYDITGIYGPSHPGRYLPETVTLPALLSETYTTAHIGKWHLGGLTPEEMRERNEKRAAVSAGPTQHGFQSYLAMEEGGGTWRINQVGGEGHLYRHGSQHLYTNDQPAPSTNQWLTDRQTDDAIKFIEGSSKNGSRPFFLNLWYDAPHKPIEPAPGVFLQRYTNMDKVVKEFANFLPKCGIQPKACPPHQPHDSHCSVLGISEAKEFLEKCSPGYKPSDEAIEWSETPTFPTECKPECGALAETAYCCLHKVKPGFKNDVSAHEDACYRSMVSNMDWNIGRIVQKLYDLDMMKNTLIVFTSDNGPESGTSGLAWPYKDRKRSMMEGGIRVPMIAVWEGKIAAGTVTDKIAITTDFLPTFTELAGVETPKDLRLDGVSIIDYLIDNQPKSNNQSTTSTATLSTTPTTTPTSVDNLQQGRPHDNTLFWGICRLGPHDKQGAVVKEGRYKLIFDAQDKPSYLFDLATDPYEGKNLLHKDKEEGEGGVPKGMVEKMSHDWQRFIGEPRMQEKRREKRAWGIL